MRLLARLAELPYHAWMRVRRALYRHGLLRQRRLAKPVISIGNIAAGGAGKTPCTIAIARFLVSHGLRVAVLTRGYGRRGTGGVVREANPDRYGDEPVLLKQAVPDAYIIVGGNRYENASLVNVDVYLLDDGFQHLRLARDFDLVIDVKGSRFHREGRSALRYADAVIPRQLRVQLPDELRGKRLFAFAGLADNGQFFRSVGAVASRGFRDHHRYTSSDLEAIRRDAREAGAEAIVTTEKDAVKLGAAADIIAVGAEFVIPDEVLQRLLAVVR